MRAQDAEAARANKRAAHAASTAAAATASRTEAGRRAACAEEEAERLRAQVHPGGRESVGRGGLVS
jgi:hypothetical protein